MGSQDPFTLLKITEDPKELHIYMSSIKVYCLEIKAEKILRYIFLVH